MELNDTIKMMESKDDKERFKAEYFQLKIRMDSLSKFLKKYREGTLSFTPKCSYDLLNAKFKTMDMYASYLEDIARIEDIEI